MEVNNTEKTSVGPIIRSIALVTNFTSLEQNIRLGMKFRVRSRTTVYHRGNTLQCSLSRTRKGNVQKFSIRKRKRSTWTMLNFLFLTRTIFGGCPPQPDKMRSKKRRKKRKKLVSLPSSRRYYDSKKQLCDHVFCMYVCSEYL